MYRQTCVDHKRNRFQSRLGNTISLDFYKSLAPYVDSITIKDRTDVISAIVKRESFWKVISDELDSVTEHKPGKPYDFVDFIIQLRNAIIPVLGKDTPEKLACQEVSKKLKRYD